MKPISLHGHERAITQIRYNRDGDLLFSASKDPTPNVWFSVNGERLGSFDGHQGAVWSIDCNWDSTRVITGAGDTTLRLWDLQTGKEIRQLVTKTAVRTVMFSFSGRMVFYTTDAAMNKKSELHVVDVTSGLESVFAVEETGMTKPTSSLWGPVDSCLLTGHENGDIVKWDMKVPGKKLQEISGAQDAHRLQINDMQYSGDQTMFITASKDTTSKLFDVGTLKRLKTFKTDRPVNSAAISPIKDHVIVGGGQEAMEVTTSAVRAGKFEARMFHLVFEEEFGRVKGHFGPINSIAFHPDGRSYSSGGEDGYVRVHAFDPPYFEFDFEY